MRAQLPAEWNIYYLSTAAQAEIDFIAIRGNQQLVVECKFSTSPTLSRGAKELIKDLNFEEVLIVSPIDGAFPLSKGVEVLSLERFSEKLRHEMYQ
jgi:predicted AAA+ superfamily ATPase